ncbi:unnamed protein product [Sphagnum compactum]
MAGGKRKSEDDGQSLNTRVAPVPMKQFGEDSAFPSLPPLDHKRAVQCLQHVRALNTQFSSWVQNQEREHLDELWQGGMEDYLKHATTIMADFRDVVDWVKAKTSSSMPGILTSTNTASSLPAMTTAKPSGNVTSILQNVSNTSGAGGFWNQTSSFPSMTTNSGFNGMSSGLGFGSAHFKPASAPLPMFPSFGVASSAPIFSSPTPQPSLSISLPQSTPFSTVAHAAVEEADDREEIEEPSSPSLKRTEEAGIKVIHDVKSKLYIKGDKGAEKPWKDMGIGQLTLRCNEDTKQGSKEAKATIVFRNDVGKVLLNAMLYPNMKANIQKTSVSTILYSASPGGGENGNNAIARMYLIKLSSESEAKSLADAILANAPNT